MINARRDYRERIHWKLDGHIFFQQVRNEQRDARRGRGNSWVNVMTREWQKHLQQGSILPSYAALNEAEFFAVACEMFFENPRPLHAAHPELYQLLQDFFNQDPRQILGNC